MEISVLQPTSLQHWALDAPSAEDLVVPRCDGRLHVTSPTSSIECALPMGLDNQDRERFFFGGSSIQFDRNYAFQPSFVAALPGGRLVGPGYAVVTHDRYLIEDSYSGDHVLQQGGLFLKTQLKIQGLPETPSVPIVLQRHEAPGRRFDHGAVVVAHYWQFNYHHWLIECLPRLSAALDLAALADCPIVVPERLLPFQRDSLELLGVPRERLLHFDGSDWQFDTLYFPSIGNFSPGQLGWIRSRLDQDNANRTDVDGLYYVSRADAATRRVANEDEVAACLSSRGFEILTLDGMPFGEQVALFDRARIVIGPHGSGLTNILFSAGNLTLIELMPDDAVNHCFWLLASALGQNYTFLPGRTINTDRDFLVPVTHLVKAVEQALKSTI